jgi:hypothetical protein
MAFLESHREPCKHGTQRPSPRLQRVGDEKPDRFVSDPIDLLELLSLLQLGNRRNGPRTACRTPAFYTSSARGSASPERPPDSPNRKTRIALLQKRRSNHEPRRAATESPNPPSSAASTGDLDGVGHPAQPPRRAARPMWPDQRGTRRAPASLTNPRFRAGIPKDTCFPARTG